MMGVFWEIMGSIMDVMKAVMAYNTQFKPSCVGRVEVMGKMTPKGMVMAVNNSVVAIHKSRATLIVGYAFHHGRD